MYDNPERNRGGGKHDMPTRRISAQPAPLPDGQTVRQPGFPTYQEYADARQRRPVTLRWVATVFSVVAILSLLLVFWGH